MECRDLKGGYDSLPFDKLHTSWSHVGFPSPYMANNDAPWASLVSSCHQSGRPNILYKPRGWEIPLCHIEGHKAVCPWIRIPHGLRTLPWDAVDTPCIAPQNPCHDHKEVLIAQTQAHLPQVETIVSTSLREHRPICWVSRTCAW